MLALMLLAGLPLQAQPLPQEASETHLGVGSCASSTCHGAVTPWRNSRVGQNEYVIWHTKDPHARSYRTLTGEAARRIARNLGLANAHEAKICLDCHADNVAPAQRARSFQLSDGVGCESCHGGSGRWLGTHIAGASTRAQSLASGMYPTDEPVARAKLCLSCHLGTKDKSVNHQMLGAGHPRLAFELDTYTVTQPAHFRVDADYRSRKRAPDPVQVWAIGQAMTAQATLGALADPARNRQGAFPELSFFDCYACHHSNSALRWAPRSSTGLGPGRIRLADASLIMVRLLARQVDPARAEILRQQTQALHQASQQGLDAMAAAAGAMNDTVGALLRRLEGHSFDPAMMKALLRDVLQEAQQREYADYLAAEQATMAAAAILAAQKRAAPADEARHKRLEAVLERAYRAVERPDTFKAADFAAALAALQEAAGRD